MTADTANQTEASSGEGDENIQIDCTATHSACVTRWHEYISINLLGIKLRLHYQQPIKISPKLLQSCRNNIFLHATPILCRVPPNQPAELRSCTGSGLLSSALPLAPLKASFAGATGPAWEMDSPSAAGRTAGDYPGPACWTP